MTRMLVFPRTQRPYKRLAARCIVRVSSPVSTGGGVGGGDGGGDGRDHDRADDDDAASASSPLHSVINPFHPRKAA
jgi:hypothetical protein